MAFDSTSSCSRLTGGIGGEGGGTGGWNVPRRQVEDSGTSSYMPFPERVRTTCHKVVHTIRKVQNDMRNMQDYTKTINSGNQTISLHEVHYDSIASIRSSIKEK
jgi:hypothetical protein